jgi:hypothetical protein
MLIFEALKAAPRYVVLDMRPGLAGFWVSRTPFSHLVILPGRIQWAVMSRDGFGCPTSLRGISACNELLRADLFHQSVIIPEEVFLGHRSLVIPMSERRHR